MEITLPAAAGLRREAPPVLRLEDVSHRFGIQQALAGVSFTVQPGEILGIIGRSGAGKSTLIRCLNGLERPDSGAVCVEGEDITRFDEVGLQRVRSRIGMVFQHFNLLSAKTAAENVALPLLITGQRRRARERRAAELLELVGLGDRGHAYTAQLSGGQKQRVGIARALAASPALLLCDEATSALDPETTDSILALLRDINRRLGLTIVLITHEMSVIRALAHRVLVMDHGRIVEEGAVADIFAQPRNPVTQSLLRGFRPSLPGSVTAALYPFARPGDRAVLRVELAGLEARAPLLADLAVALGLRPVLLHGGIEDVQGTPVGTLFLGLSAEPAGIISQAIAFLAARAQSAEVIGYVAGPA